jgi:V-type H+-transporting ATPase subunit H
LIKLAHSSDEEIAAIACFDIGEFVRHYPNGKHIARRLGARDVVMGLIEHEDMEVQRQALLCISKMLVHNWQVSS